MMNENEIFISPIVRLELQFLSEIGRVNEPADEIVADLANRIGIRVCEKDFNTVVNQAMMYTWTRDPFDRLIVAHAELHNNILISKDQDILDHYPHARW
jgi:PIN domain nuclease of toxin-antitoxin system